MNGSTRVAFGRFEWRPAQRLLLEAGRPAVLKSRAMDVLDALIASRDRVVGKAELLDRVWGRTVVEEANLHVHISALRKVLGAGAITTVPGRGYRFTAAVEEDGPTHAAGAIASQPSQPAPGLIGRAEELTELMALLQTHRLVTIVGAGGIGKTRLAKAAAASSAGTWPGCVIWVEAAAVLAAPQLPQAVALALGLAPGEHRTASALAASLKARRALLVIDNCEHVVDAVAALASALRAAPEVHLLVTSQELLNLPDEQVLRLSPLAVPPPGQPADERYGAVRLFMERARAVDRAFALDDSNRAVVGEICRALDGLPLALELAAGRVRQFGVQALHARLADRLRLLVGGARDARPQHRTLRAALEWSYTLLGPTEQVVWRRLGVFVGGFTLEMAQQVATDCPGESGRFTAIDAWAVLDAIGVLVDRSMVALDAAEPVRYRLLETMRLYALEQLALHGEQSRWHERHARAVLALFAAAERESAAEGVAQEVDPLRLTMPEIDNARSAIAWAMQTGAHGLAIELVAKAAKPFVRRGTVFELLPTMQALLPHLDAAPAGAQVALLNRLGSHGRQVGMAQDEVRRIKADAVDRARAAGERPLLHAALASFGWALAADGETDAAEQVLAEAIALERADDPPAWRVPRLGLQIRLAEMSGDFEACIAASYDARAAVERIPSEAAALAIAESNLRLFLCAVGRFEEAVSIGRHALARAGRPRPTLHEVYSMVMPLAAIGAVDEVRALLSGRRADIERHPATVVQYALEGLAMLAAACGRFDDALQLLVEQQRRRHAEGRPLDALTVAARGHVLERCRAAGYEEATLPAWRLTGPLLDGLGVLALGMGTETSTHASAS